MLSRGLREPSIDHVPARSVADLAVINRYLSPLLLFVLVYTSDLIVFFSQSRWHLPGQKRYGFELNQPESYLIPMEETHELLLKKKIYWGIVIVLY